MKKTLVALAALASIGAMAQSSFTVYGLLDAGIRQDSNGAKSSSGSTQSQTQFLNGVLNTSRFGIKGTQDLGNGNKANFKLESGLKVGNGESTGNTVTTSAVPSSSTTVYQNGNSTLFDRTASVGLQSSLGMVDFGRVTSFAYDLAGSYTIDPMGFEMTNNNQNTGVKAFNPNPLGLLIGSSFYTVRRDNTIKYVGTFDNLSVGLAYSLAGNAGSQTPGSSTQAMAKYSTPMFTVAASGDSIQDANGLKQTLNTFGGNVTVSGFKLTAGTTQMKTPAGFAPVAQTFLNSAYSNPAGYILGGVATQDTKLNVNDFGVAYQLGSYNIVGAYYNTKIQQAGLSDNTFNSYMMRVRYALHTTTDIFVEADSTKSSGLDSAKTAGMSSTNTGFTVGVQYRF